MDRCFNYAVVQLEAHPIRDERLNVGIVVFDHDTVDVFPARNLEKIRAISAAVDVQCVSQAIENLKSADALLINEGLRRAEDRCKALADFSALKFSGLGRFSAGDATSYHSEVSRLIWSLVEPEPAVRRVASRPRSRLLSAVKYAFRAERILAAKGETLESHRVVLNEKLAEGLNADMLLKNGAMHVMQTVDASHSEKARTAIQEIGISSLVFEQARIFYGENETRPRLVYSANSSLEKLIEPALLVAAHQGAQLINWESKDDRTSFIVEISMLAEASVPQKRANFGAVNVSHRHNHSLN